MAAKLAPSRVLLLLALLILASLCEAVTTGQFDTCHEVVLSILNGTLTRPSPLGEINNVTIYSFGYIYEGPVMFLKPSCPRSGLLTLTLDGCRAICGPQIQLAEPAGALSLTATWIFPLAILFNLPFEGHPKHKVRHTLAAVLNWLGSPATALAATIWNVVQIRQCRQHAANRQALKDALHVLSIINQFDLKKPESAGKDIEDGVDKILFHKTLIYGLFRPLAHLSLELKKQLADARSQPAGHEQLTHHEPLDILLTRDLLAELVFQLRTLRRRTVIPTLGSLAVFLVAFIFSVVLTFGEVDDEVDVVYMSIGLFVLWLPVLVAFGIIDKNPVSSVRTAELVERWLYNVDVVRTWAMTESTNEGLDPPFATLKKLKKQWWNVDSKKKFSVGKFVGQGRTMQYCGLVHAVLTAIEWEERVVFQNGIDEYDNYGIKAACNLAGPKPPSWYATTTVAFLLVWTEIMMAVMFAFMTPTVGPGCWSGSCFLYGALSSISWFIQFRKKPRGWWKAAAYFFNGLAFVWLIAAIVMQLSGMFFNCYCLSSPIASPLGWGGFMSFGNAAEFRDSFDLVGWWIGFAVVGGTVPVVAFVVALFWWLKCQPMWKVNQRGERHADQNRMIGNKVVRADMTWLQE
ncbi:hypothetical protein B0T16DRAFT_358933 [Cercophora newfieldiana]|uniref:Uncharacterized protein n=1 Tax=Cercophora newfieldiana TaxID=92897 RepID=A0AA40CK72_9PEZI|nr:hypothetical protein B0T16DRAFT_358933 [Cercophora newfieldiana]